MSTAGDRRVVTTPPASPTGPKERDAQGILQTQADGTQANETDQNTRQELAEKMEAMRK